MDSAAHDLKFEPVSPPDNGGDLLWSSDTDTDLYWTTDELLEADLTACDSKVEVLSKILDNLDQLEDLSQYIKSDEDAFTTCWMEEKMLPNFEETLEVKPVSGDKYHLINSSASTQNLLKEFETVFDAVNNGAFTPPQSPPYHQPVLTTLEPIGAANIYAVNPNDHTYPALVPDVKNLVHVDYIPSTPQTDVAHELAVVDELVRTRVEFLVPSSPSSSSSSSNFGDCSSDDPEWSADLITQAKASTQKLTRKRSKPYSHGGDDKKSRKKEQNKNAATRYRMKKKAEVEEILGEEKVLHDKNVDLENNIVDLQREIKCLKGLMRDLFKAKGLIN